MIEGEVIVMRSAEEMIAYALEMDVSLLPFAAELLVDFEELGSDPELIVDVIRELDLPDGACVIDLGSGKGAVTLEIAREIGCETVGVELFEPFVRSARALAESVGVARHCRLVHGDELIREAIEEADDSEDTEEPESIARRVSEIAMNHPQHAEELLAFAKSKEAQCVYTEDNLTGAIRVLKRH